MREHEKYVELEWFYFRRNRPPPVPPPPPERVSVIDCFSMCHNQGTVPGLLPPIPDGWVEYSVWARWTRGGAGWISRLFVIREGSE